MKHTGSTLLVILFSYLGLISINAQTTVTDYDGNKYQTVTIGKQVWIASNLKTTHYNDGAAIPLVKDSIAWGNLNTSGYCWYKNNQTVYGNTYGALYNWYAVETGKLCPLGWHIPTEADWTTLTGYLGGEKVAAGKLKETGKTHWIETSPETTNSTGFTALPGGSRMSYGPFNFIGTHGVWWSSEEKSLGNAWLHSMLCNGNDLFTVDYDKMFAVSVRCIKN